MQRNVLHSGRQTSWQSLKLSAKAMLLTDPLGLKTPYCLCGLTPAFMPKGRLLSKALTSSGRKSSPKHPALPLSKARQLRLSAPALHTLGGQHCAQRTGSVCTSHSNRNIACAQKAMIWSAQIRKIVKRFWKQAASHSMDTGTSSNPTPAEAISGTSHSEIAALSFTFPCSPLCCKNLNLCINGMKHYTVL